MPPSLLRLSEIWTRASVTMMEIYCVSMTSILWWDLRECVSYYLCGCIYPLHYCFWTSSLSTMNYQQYTTHGLTTAKHYDHTWTAQWAHNMCAMTSWILHMIHLLWPCTSTQRHRFGAPRGKWLPHVYIYFPPVMSLMVTFKRALWCTQ